MVNLSKQKNLQFYHQGTILLLTATLVVYIIGVYLYKKSCINNKVENWC